MRNIEILNEEIKRFKLLSGYDTKTTLNENLNIISEIRGRIKSKVPSLIKALTAAERGLLLREIDDLLKGVLGKKPLNIFDKAKNPLTKSDDVLRALENGALYAKDLQKLNDGLFRGTKNLSIKKAIAEDIATSSGFAKIVGSQTEKDAKTLLKSNGYTDEEIKMLVTSYKKSGNVFGRIPVKPSPAPAPPPKKNNVKPAPKKNTRPRTKKSAHSVAKTKPKTNKSLLSKALSLVKGVLLGKAFLWLLGLGLAAWAIYEWFLNEDDTGFPDCLKLMIPADDWEKMVDEKLNYVLISETGVPEIDDEGGGKFFQDKKFESVNGELLGTWDDDFDGGVSVEVNGITLELPCDGLNLTPEDVTDVTQEIVYGPCTRFPLVIGCENNVLIDIKKCLGFTDLSNKFDEQLRLALVRAGYGETLTEDIYNRIIEICEDREAIKNFKGSQSGLSSLEDI